MRRTSFAPGSWWRQALRRVTAMVTASQLLVVVTAPLAERADSSVAPVHAEQAGTSSHHAHGDFCAVCTATHLTALPPRSGSLPDLALLRWRAVELDDAPPARRAERYSLARAPPA